MKNFKTRILVFLISVGLVLIAIYYTSAFSYAIRNSHTINLTDYKRYLWVFKDSVKRDIDTFYFAGDLRKSDNIYKYQYKHKYHIVIWEFNNSVFLDSNSMITKKITPTQIRIYNHHEIINEKLRNWPKITIDLNYQISDTLQFGIDHQALILHENNFQNYCSLHLSLGHLTILNKQGVPIIFLDYSSTYEPVQMVCYKNLKNSVLILINSSTKRLDEDIVKILNLPGK